MNTSEAKGRVFTYYEGKSYAKQVTSRLADIGTRIAGIKGYDYAGEFETHKRYEGSQPLSGEIYFIPVNTLVGDQGRSLGIKTKNDLFGGIVPHPHVATKAVAHSLVQNAKTYPNGWSAEFGEAVKGVVLPGYTAFSVEDALHGYEDLVRQGMEVRAKETLALNSQGQSVLSGKNDLSEVLHGIPQRDLQQYGLVLEGNLTNVKTRSVGQVEVEGIVASYYGQQYDTTDWKGRKTYGGSDIFIVRGGYDQLLRYVPEKEARLAIQQAETFDRAALKHLRIVASRRNYDVGQGFNRDRQYFSGVFEQSWRTGGVSGPEILALEAFHKDPSLTTLNGSSVKQFTRDPVNLPSNGILHFQGPDLEGHVAVYSTIARVDAQPISKIDSGNHPPL